MPYLDESRLSTYDSKLKEWVSSQESKTITSNIYPWTKTAKAGAVSCYPVGGTELKPTVNFTFSETGPASGDKGPDNPSTITGVSEVNLWLAGKNVNRTMPYYGFTDGVKVHREVTFTANQDGSVTANGTATGGDAMCALFNVNSVTTYGTSIGVGTWRLSGCPSGGSNSSYYIQPILTSGYGSSVYDYGSGSTITVTKPGAKIGLVLRIASGYTAQNLVFKPQIELASVATEYEQPVEKQNFTISLGSTYYGGTIDLATGLMTVTHWGHVFDGTETPRGFTALGSNGRCFFFDVQAKDGINQTCSHLPLLVDFASDTSHFYINYGGSNTGLVMFAPFLTEASLMSWLADEYAAGTPVTVTCELKTPYTVQLSPLALRSLVQPDKYTPRLNTVYTDASAVQVGYIKSPIREEFELQQAIVSQGGEI